MERGKNFPTKTRINLAQKERKHRDLGAAAVTAVILTVAIAGFCKFGVIDRLGAVSAAEAQAEEQGRLASQLQEKTKDYDQVLEEYQSYVSAQNVAGGADPADCLDLIEQELLGRAQIQSFAVAPDLITVELSGVTLNDISRIYQSLMSSQLVGGVQVYTASTEEQSGARVTASMTIRLNVLTPSESGEEAVS